MVISDNKVTMPVSVQSRQCTDAEDSVRVKSLLGRLDGEFVPPEVLLPLPVVPFQHRPAAQPLDDLLQVADTPLLDSVRVHAGLVVISHTSMVVITVDITKDGPYLGKFWVPLAQVLLQTLFSVAYLAGP